MAVVPSFRYDLFVSYAHADDDPWQDGRAGWVTEFVRTVTNRLRRESRDVAVWFDPQLRTGDDFNDAIQHALSESAVFLSVLSPAYCDSTYCKHEVRLFRERLHPGFGMKVGTLSRMQGILIDDLELEKWPPELRTTSPCLFFGQNKIRTNKPREEDETHPYVQGMHKVARSIWDVLEAMRDQKKSGTAIDQRYAIPQTGAGDRVLALADVTDDLFNKRENLRQSLAQLPGVQTIVLEHEGELPPSALSVHFFGRYPGRPVPGKDVSLGRLQFQSAVEGEPKLRPLVWIARDVSPETAETDAHRAFLTALFDDSRIELVRVSFEDLKDDLAARFREAIAARGRARARPDPIVHIWHRTDDPAPLTPLKEYLKRQRCGISVFSQPSLAPTALQSRLAFCDGLIVPYTGESKSWAEDTMMQAFQLRRSEERPLAFAAVALPPSEDGPFNFEHPKVLPIRATADGFDGMDRFLSLLQGLDV